MSQFLNQALPFFASSQRAPRWNGIERGRYWTRPVTQIYRSPAMDPFMWKTHKGKETKDVTNVWYQGEDGRSEAETPKSNSPVSVKSLEFVLSWEVALDGQKYRAIPVQIFPPKFGKMRANRTGRCKTGFPFYTTNDVTRCHQKMEVWSRLLRRSTLAN